MVLVFFVIETTVVAENVTSTLTAANSSSNTKYVANSDVKNKRQINQFVRTPGATSVASETESVDRVQPQTFPSYLTHSIYSQQPIYARRPTQKTDSSTNDDDNQEQEPQPNEVIFILYFIIKFLFAKITTWK